MRQGSILGVAVFAMLGTLLALPPAPATAARDFVDLAGSPFADDARWLQRVGVTEGCNPPTNDWFCPGQAVTRAQMAAFLDRALDLPEATDPDPFRDDDASPFEDEIARLAAAGITEGCNPPTNDAFCGGDVVTRGQMALFLDRALGLALGDGEDLFGDDDGRLYEDAAERLATAGITLGCNPPANDAFCGGDVVTRGQMAAFLHRGLLDVLGDGTTTSDAPLHVLTVGSAESSPYALGQLTTRSGHGNRIYCAISHFSYDDPVVLPGQSGAAHLHMFWGNTSTDASTDASRLVTTGRSSCEGGTNYRSSLWMPALHRADGAVLVPEQTFIYYKTFLPGDLPDTGYELLQEVPQGLAFLANGTTLNAEPQYQLRWGSHADGTELLLDIQFPSCVATDDGTRTGEPVLDFRDMPGADAGVVNSHVAYPGGPDRNALGCPASHPYRFPTPIAIISFDAAEAGQGYYLSSDAAEGAEPMSTLHADYVFGVSAQANATILRCTIEARSCGFEGGRGQLPGRFLAPDGTAVYENSVTLVDDADRTPFGVLPSTWDGS